MDAVTLRSVTKRFDRLTAVSDLSLSIRENAFFGLLGPNGAGKTTTLRMLLRMIVPDTGDIEVLGQPISHATPDRIGYLPEERGLYPRMRVRQVLVFLSALKGLPEAEADRRARQWLERLDMSDWMERRIDELSKGMQQKVQFIAAVLHEPPLLILDEPFSGFDPVNVALVKNIMLDLRERGTTIILSTHRMEQVEMLCDSICLIHQGRKVLAGELREIKKAFGRNMVRIEYCGNRDGLGLERFATEINEFGQVVEAKLRPGIDPQGILKAAVERGVALARFELIEPPLADIFVETVTQARA